MPNVNVQVDGLRELVRDLERAGVEVADLKESFSKIADEASESARGHTPRRSGALAASVRGNKAKNKAIVTFGKARTPYAGPILYGWPARGIKRTDTIQRTDTDMATRAPALFSAELDRIFEKYGFES